MYCDSAIFVKLLCREPDSDFFERELSGEPLRSCELARAEVFAALVAKERAGHIQAADRDRAWRLFVSWIEDETVVLDSLDARVFDRAIHTIHRCHPRVPVRTLDALHVAACDLASEFPLAATDVRLRAAAHQAGIPLFPARLPNDTF
jgi:predicted nucleic acid-binding protein